MHRLDFGVKSIFHLLQIIQNVLRDLIFQISVLNLEGLLAFLVLDRATKVWSCQIRPSILFLGFIFMILILPVGHITQIRTWWFIEQSIFTGIFQIRLLCHRHIFGRNHSRKLCLLNIGSLSNLLWHKGILNITWIEPLKISRSTIWWRLVGKERLSWLPGPI